MHDVVHFHEFRLNMSQTPPSYPTTPCVTHGTCGHTSKYYAGATFLDYGYQMSISNVDLDQQHATVGVLAGYANLTLNLQQRR
jgi:hypothetical protein